ncbi:MAG: threonylcarbamoyl-AMP synthase [Candidatus Heimdallarchaeota archaeon]|nr:threonylcarbamoyl-AMP synthase [Candidatus Heimdallarchaeota archaeon]MCK4770256.1 threonylcarbamoyl-AMP synthase [Candidatus Heimdallarchaeota archaeon]
MKDLQTETIELSSESSIQKAIKLATEMIDEGEIIAFPTDTLYGLGCNVFNESAIRNLFEIKNRSFTKPINVLIGSIEQLSYVAENIPIIVHEVIREFWPGDLTLILHKRGEIPSILTNGMSTIGVRMPNNDVTLRLIREIDKPLATTSANISGRPSITNANQILENFEDKIPLILDGGVSEIGEESTIVSLVTEPPSVIRVGSLPIEKLKRIINNLEV